MAIGVEAATGREACVHSPATEQQKSGPKTETVKSASGPRDGVAAVEAKPNSGS